MNVARLLVVSIAIIHPWAGVHAQQGAPQVIIASAEQMPIIEEVPVSGSVISPRVARLSAQVNGSIEQLNVEIGDRVKAGDEILHLDAELNSLSLAAAQAATEQALEELSDARRRLRDIEALAQRKTASENERQSLAAEVRIDSAALERFRAEQQRQEALLERHVIKAPFAGVISRRMVELGEWIEPGDAVVELVATNDLRIDLQVPQAVFAKLDQTTDVQVTLDALARRQFDGRIVSVIPVTDPASRTFLVRVALNDATAPLTPGMSAAAVLRLNTGLPGIVVPRDALLRYPDGRVSVWVVDRDGDKTTVREQQVETGLSFDGRIAITRGLAQTTQVVVQGNEALREGQTVTVQHPAH